MTTPFPMGIAIIFCTTKNKEGTITHFGVQALFDDEAKHLPKADVVAEAKAGTEFTPLWEDGAGKRHLGLKCHVTGDHIEADPDDTICNNLGELPACPA